MKSTLKITPDPIDEAKGAADRAFTPTEGAVVTFFGIVRQQEAGERIMALDYEAFREMAEHQFDLIFKEIEKRWPVASIQLIHRVGRVRVGEASLWVEISAPHRAEAFAACQYLIDEMKKVVPIWKKAVPAS